MTEIFTPKTIDEWLDERISFTKSIIDSTTFIDNLNSQMMSDFTLSNANFKYCKELYEQHKAEKDNDEVKKLFKNIARKLLIETILELDKQEYVCTKIEGKICVTMDKSKLPQQTIDNIQKIRMSLEEIYNKIIYT